MEHKLILGGGQYLAFARSRIKALRASGARYGAWRWQMPGAELVTVRLEGEHDYIRLEGGGALLAMDSGVIDLKGIAPASALRFANGTRGDTLAAAAYAGAFALGATAGKWAQWKSDPAQIPNHQMIGAVEVPKFAGHVKADQASSFESARRPNNPPTIPQGWNYKPDDDVLLAKKLMVAGCPASVFTGRTRLFVQAVYGRPLYDYGGEGSLQQAISATARPSLAASAPPALSLPAYARKSDATPYPPVVIDTSAGVRYDPATGKHWLMLINGASLDIYPLLSSKTGESMRKYLVNPAVEKATLTADDQDKLEAYILAYCLPDVKNKWSIAAGASTPGYSMGYGWHWNWSGTYADIVTTTNFDQGGGNSGMESTHRRIGVTVAADGTWSAGKVIVEGPTRWAVSRVYWCIAEPEWGTMSTVKSTPKLSTLFACDAPFYAFYKRDELQVCRVAVTAEDSVAAVRVFTPGFCDTPYGALPQMLTAGTRPGFCEDLAAVSSHHTATISCGSFQASGLVIGKAGTSARWDVRDKYMLGDTSHIPSNDVFVPPGDTGTVQIGYPFPWNLTGYDTGSYTGPGYEGVGSLVSVRLTKEISNIERSESSTATVIVPFNDAEAAFVEATKYTSEVRSNRHVTVYDNTSFLRFVLFFPLTGMPSVFTTALVSSAAGALVSDALPDPITTDTVDPVKKLLCVAGALDATMDDLASFHNANDYADVSYTSLCGVQNSGAVIAPGHVTSGLTTAAPDLAALVGWI